MMSFEALQQRTEESLLGRRGHRDRKENGGETDGRKISMNACKSSSCIRLFHICSIVLCTKFKAFFFPPPDIQIPNRRTY